VGVEFLILDERIDQGGMKRKARHEGALSVPPSVGLGAAPRGETGKAGLLLQNPMPHFVIPSSVCRVCILCLLLAVIVYKAPPPLQDLDPGRGMLVAAVSNESSDGSWAASTEPMAATIPDLPPPQCSAEAPSGTAKSGPHQQLFLAKVARDGVLLVGV
jgi:hypothetical protein